MKYKLLIDRSVEPNRQNGELSINDMSLNEQNKERLLDFLVETSIIEDGYIHYVNKNSISDFADSVDGFGEVSLKYTLDFFSVFSMCDKPSDEKHSETALRDSILLMNH